MSPGHSVLHTQPVLRGGKEIESFHILHKPSKINFLQINSERRGFKNKIPKIETRSRHIRQREVLEEQEAALHNIINLGKMRRHYCHHNKRSQIIGHRRSLYDKAITQSWNRTDISMSLLEKTKYHSWQSVKRSSIWT